MPGEKILFQKGALTVCVCQTLAGLDCETLYRKSGSLAAGGHRQSLNFGKTLFFSLAHYACALIYCSYIQLLLSCTC